MTAVPACLQCGAASPPADEDCPLEPSLLTDHFVGTGDGCPHCGRPKEACSRRPCQAERHRRLSQDDELDDVFSPGAAAPD